VGAMVAHPIEICPAANRKSAEQRAALIADPAFGSVFTEHMISLQYSEGRGWTGGRLEPYGPLQLSPAASVLHYGQAIFEGFKAFRQPDGGIATFRPEANARRFQASARRLAMPELPVETFVNAADVLIAHERDWVPAGRGRSLYLRPLLVATDPALGVRPSRDYLFLLLGSPAGAYFKGGIESVTVWICEDYVRAAPGGTGAVKTAGNYAASLPAQAQAMREGCAQVVWLDAVTRRNVEEMGGMNIFFVYEDAGKTSLVTPKLTGSLLPGITRDSLLAIGKELGYGVEERTVTIEEWLADAASGKMTESFACGTAAVITPIGALKNSSGIYPIRDGSMGPVSMRLREYLMDIQYGVVADSRGWMHRVV
jgi:branched-chain amino acid aminotransferase